MLLVILILVWYAFGFLSAINIIYNEEKHLTIGHLFVALTIGGIFGLITMIVYLLTLFCYTSVGRVKIIK